MITLTIGTDLKMSSNEYELAVRGDKGFTKFTVAAPSTIDGVSVADLTARLRYTRSDGSSGTMNMGVGVEADSTITYTDFEETEENIESYQAMFQVNQGMVLSVSWEDDTGDLFKSTIPNDAFKIINDNAGNSTIELQQSDAIKALELNKLDNDGDSKDNTVTFSSDATLENIASGEKHSTLFGKISKLFTDFIAHLTSNIAHADIRTLISDETTARAEADNLKVDKVTGKSLIADSEITRLATTLTGTASGTNTGDETQTTIKAKLGITTLSGSNTGDQDLSGLVPKTDIVNDLTTGGTGKVLSAEQGKTLNTSKVNTSEFDYVVGKNKYDKSLAIDNKYYLNSTGVLQSYTGYCASGQIPVSENTAYAVTVTGGTIPHIIFWQDNTYLSYAGGTAITGGKKFTTPARCNKLAFNILLSNPHTTEQFQSAINTAQLELGSIGTLYEPYTLSMSIPAEKYPYNTDVLNLKEMYFLSTGKNQYDNSSAVNGKYIYNSNGGIADLANSAIIGFTPVESNKQYVISVDPSAPLLFGNYLHFYDANYVWKKAVAGSGYHIEFATDSDTAYINAHFGFNVAHTVDDFNATINTMQLEDGTGRTTFETYEEQGAINSNNLKDRDFISSIKKWKSKKWLSLGTSITWYNGQYFNATTTPCYGYQSHVCLDTGLLLTNAGVSGSTIGKSANYSFIDHYTEKTYTAYDLVTIEYAVNDWNQSVAFGTVGTPDTTTFCGSYQTVLNYIIAQSPLTRIVLFTPFCNSIEAKGGKTLLDFRNAIIAIANLYALPYVDLYMQSGIIPATVSSLCIDSTHPNNYGHRRIGGLVSGTIKNL